MYINFENELHKRKSLRQKSTPQEKILWDKLRNSKLGCKFRRQHSIGAYVADFYCHEKKLVIELDGFHHLQNKEYDQERDSYFESFGLRILRFWNDAIDRDLENTLSIITQALKTPHP